MPRVLITGANRGLGAAAARELAERGYEVVLAARDPASADEALAALPGSGHRVVRLDVTDPSTFDAALEAGPYDVLINNAGVLGGGDALEVAPDAMDRHWAVNVRGPWELMQRIVPGMAPRGGGRVVNVSSGGGSFGEGSMMKGQAAYAVSKAALNALTVVAAAVAPAGVKINAACPGWVRTRMGGDAAPRSIDEGVRGIVWLATLDDGGPSGGFFRDGEPIPW